MATTRSLAKRQETDKDTGCLSWLGFSLSNICPVCFSCKTHDLFKIGQRRFLTLHNMWIDHRSKSAHNWSQDRSYVMQARTVFEVYSVWHCCTKLEIIFQSRAPRCRVFLFARTSLQPEHLSKSVWPTETMRHDASPYETQFSFQCRTEKTFN
jgi:hypothetical protein